MIMDDHHLAWLALSELNLTFKQGFDLAQLYSHGATILEQQLSPQLVSILSHKQRQCLARLTSQPLQLSLAKQLHWVESNNALLLLYDDMNYPEALKSIHHPPAFLWLQGRSSLLNEPCIAMVGARRATANGMALAKTFAASLGASGLTIVSGLALGIDGACHQGALDAQADTIAVLGSGLGQIYPLKHQPLAQRILAGAGLLVSPWPLMAKPLGYRFPARNRIISGLSMGVLVLEAALRSGSLITAKTALEQGREVFAVPSSVHNVQAHGCHQLIRNGAILVDQPQQVLTELALQLRPWVGRYQPQDLTIQQDSGYIVEELQKLLRVFGYDPVPVDILCAQLDEPYNVVAAQLVELELLGLVRLTVGGYEKVL
ncbi:MAG: DNA processing protein [Candidatus Paceibacteria bacterium]|jgi:DNA processing protein|tara:strand:- start:24130 stop:25251 length:1122 start_codon:yes stop_codon:yes gene_type:complete